MDEHAAIVNRLDRRVPKLARSSKREAMPLFEMLVANARLHPPASLMLDAHFFKDYLETMARQSHAMGITTQTVREHPGLELALERKIWREYEALQSFDLPSDFIRNQGHKHTSAGLADLLKQATPAWGDKNEARNAVRRFLLRERKTVFPSPLRDKKRLHNNEKAKPKGKPAPKRAPLGKKELKHAKTDSRAPMKEGYELARLGHALWTNRIAKMGGFSNGERKLASLVLDAAQSHEHARPMLADVHYQWFARMIARQAFLQAYEHETREPSLKLVRIVLNSATAQYEQLRSLGIPGHVISKNGYRLTVGQAVREIPAINKAFAPAGLESYAIQHVFSGRFGSALKAEAYFHHALQDCLKVFSGEPEGTTLAFKAAKELFINPKTTIKQLVNRYSAKKR